MENMRNVAIFRKMAWSGAALLILGLFAVSLARGAEEPRPEFFVTWRAQSYAPSSFSGKLLPTAKSIVTASFELVQNGTRVDISDETIYWYVNDNFLTGGKGVHTASFRAADRAGGTQELRIQIDSYKKQSMTVSKTIDIPIAKPEAIIETRLPNNRFSGENITVYGKPYFFNVQNLSDLVFSWQVNGKKPAGSENPDRLDINAPTGNAKGLTVGLTVRNSKNIYEGVFSSINLSPGQ